MKKLVGLAMVLGLVLLLTGVSMAADSNTVTVTANVVGTCKFLTGGTMAFGGLDPSSGAAKAATVTQPTFWCTKGASYTISDDLGMYEVGAQRKVKHASLDEYINYSMSYTITGTGDGRTVTKTMDIAGTISFADYQDASAGGYSDTITLTISP